MHTSSYMCLNRLSQLFRRCALQASVMATAVAYDHERCRYKVCVVCYRKGNRKLSSTDISTINDHVIEGYDIGNPDFPASLCNGCYLILSKRRNGHENIEIPFVDDYDPLRPTDLRSKQSCSCRICNVAKLNMQDAVKLKKKSGRPSDPNSNTRNCKKIKICSQCFAQIYSGCSHNPNSCASKSRVLKNLSNLINSSPTSEHVRVVKEHSSTISLNDQPASSKYMLSSDNMAVIQNDLNLSTRATLSLAQNIRKTTSRDAIEPYLKDKLYEKNHRLDDFFEVKESLFSHHRITKKLHDHSFIARICIP